VKKAKKSEKNEKKRKIDLNFASLCFALKPKVLNRREAKNFERKICYRKEKKQNIPYCKLFFLCRSMFFHKNPGTAHAEIYEK
jgi:hypothetical protein